MKRRFCLCGAFLVVLLMLACTNEWTSPTVETTMGQDVKLAKLDALLMDGKDDLAQLGLSFIGYQDQGVISGVEAIERVKKELLSDDAVFPYYEKLFDGLKIISMKEMKKIWEEEGRTQEINDIIASMVVDGVRVLKLNWLYNGDKINSTCLIVDEDGTPVYDQLLSNMVRNFSLIDEKGVVSDTTVSTRITNPAEYFSICIPYGGSYDPFMGGSGRVTILVTLECARIYGVPEIRGFDASVEHESTGLMKAAGNVALLEKQYGANGYVVYTWAWGVSTSGVSITMQIGANGVALGFTVNYGNGKGGSGIETVRAETL